jgi:hypothetical protein
MGANARARAPEEQAAVTRQPWELSYGHRRDDWPGLLSEPCEPAHDELGLLRGKVSGHRWDGWRRLTADEGYFAACSCGWRSTETTGDVSPMLRQIEEHLDAVQAVRSWRPSAGPAETRPDERTRELYALVENQRRHLSQALEHSRDLLSASGDQAERFVAVLEHAAAKVAPEWARTRASVRSAEALQRRAERARELRNEIVAAAATVAAIAEEVALVGQDLETDCIGGFAEYRRLADEAANRHGGREVVAG